MLKESVITNQAPQAIGPYSQAVSAGAWVFVSGQIALDPKTQELIAGGIAAQTQRALENIKAILQAQGLHMAHVVKTTIYMKDLAEFSQMNSVYAQFFEKPYPARATVQVAALPRGAGVEIEAIAISNESRAPNQPRL